MWCDSELLSKKSVVTLVDHMYHNWWLVWRSQNRILVQRPKSRQLHQKYGDILLVTFYVSCSFECLGLSRLV